MQNQQGQGRLSRKSRELFLEAQRIFPGGVNSPVRAFKAVGGDPFIVERGEGAYLIDADGNRYIDYINSWGPLVLGHAHPAVVAAITEQASLGSSYGASTALESELGRKIMEQMPHIEMLRFVNSGTEAAMSVLRLARGFTKREAILKFSGCYHGHVDSLLVQAGSGMATLGLPDSAGVPESFVRNTLVAPFNDIQAVRDIINKRGKELAAVILEPVCGNAGLILPKPEFLSELRSLCTECGALLIFDEVMTGFRVSLGGASKLYGVKPDLTMLGKVIGGGLPVGAFGGRQEVMRLMAPLGPVYQAGTLSGNPLAMAAGIATLGVWCQGENFEKVTHAAKTLMRELKSAGQKNNMPLVTSSIGTMFGFFFQSDAVSNYEEAKLSEVKRFAEFFTLMLDQGVYLAPSQFEAGFVSLAHVGDPIQRTIEAFDNALSKLVH